MKERLLLMGPPGSGKSKQLLNCAAYLNQEYGVIPEVIDLEDKMEAMVKNMVSPPDITLYNPIEWDSDDAEFPGLNQCRDKVVNRVKRGDWIMLDRIDLAWPWVQRWFTQEKHKETLAQLMMDNSKKMSRPSMFTPTQDQGSWQVINEQYEDMINSLLYRSRCNIIMTTGIRGVDDNSPLDIGRLGILPRGQKELGHQPHSTLLLHQDRQDRKNPWRISTDKDLELREYYDNESIVDFGWEYLALYFDPKA